MIIVVYLGHGIFPPIAVLCFVKSVFWIEKDMS